ncbi:MAG: hypothetical protein ACQGVK_19235 [Myxococcota bacterium]
MPGSASRAAAVALALGLGVGLAAAGLPGAVGAEAPDPIDASAQLPEGSGASEQWDVVAVLESGHRIFARFLITNLGPGTGNGAVLGHLVFPDGDTFEFRNGRRPSEWELRDDGRELTLGHSRLELDATLADGTRGHLLEITKDKIQIHLPIAPRAAASIARGRWPEGYRSDLLALDAPTRARFRVPSLMQEEVVSPGRVSMVHTWAEDAEEKHARARFEFFGFDGDRGVYFTELRPPVGEPSSWLKMNDSHGGANSYDLGGVSWSGARNLARGRGYWLPERLGVRSEQVEVTLDTGPIIMEVNPLVVLPPPFRWLIALSTRPHRVWADCDFHVKFRPSPEPPVVTQVTGVAVTTFLNPMDPD